MTAAKLALFLFRNRKLIREFLPIVQALLAMLQNNAPRAAELRDRPDTNPVRDLMDFTIETEASERYAELTPNEFSRKVFKLD